MARETRPLTGRTVLLITVSAFGVIIGVNFFMAYLAVGSFPGLEVENSYVASQSFDRERLAQEHLGWTVDSAYEDGAVRLSITGRDGQPARIRTLDVMVGRTTHANADTKLAAPQAQSPYRFPVALDYGKWELRVFAVAEDGTAFRQRRTLVVRR